jgi:hypothetical protein
MSSEPSQDPGASTEQAGMPPDRRRILAALGALVGFGALTAVVLVATAGDERGSLASPAPRECLEAWNGDREAIGFARHNSIFHNYNRAEVGYVDLQAEELDVSADSSGRCAVVFARGSIDPEPEAAGQFLDGAVWRPLNEVTDINTLARLQSEAFEGANAAPTPGGRIVPSRSST